MSATIKYGDYDFNNQPTPFISRSEESILAGEKWGTQEVFNLRGQITGCSFGALRSGQLDLIQGFSRDFKNLEILQNNPVVYSGDYVFYSGDLVTYKQSLSFVKSGLKVESINFPSNPYRGILDYEIKLSHYPEDYFQYYGVTDPANSWSFEEGEDGIMSATHTISCKGFTTNSDYNNALQNARNFVNSKTGLQSAVNPHFICKSTYPDYQLCLNSFSENINRIDGTYSITENYVADLEGINSGVLRYSVDLNSGVDGFSTASIQGNVDGCRSDSMEFIRAKFQAFDIQNAVSDAYQNYFGFVDLNSTPVSRQITEDSLNKKITFNSQYDNDQSSSTILDLQTTVASGDEFVSVSLNGNIRGRGDIFGQQAQIESRFNSLNIFNLANEAYVDYLGGGVVYPLNPKPESYGTAKNSFIPEISFNATYSNKEIPPEGFESFNRNISFAPSMKRLKPVALFDQNGSYDIVDLLFHGRASLNVSLNGIAEAGQNAEDLSSTMESETNFLISKYGVLNSLKLESYDIKTGNLGEYSLNAAWSFDTTNKVINGTDYDTVNTLKLK